MNGAKRSAVHIFWLRYEVPVILIGTAFAVLAFMYANFMTRNDGEVLDLRITRSNDARVREDTRIQQDIKSELSEIRQDRLEDRKILNAILMEARKN